MFRINQIVMCSFETDFSAGRLAGLEVQCWL